MKAAAERNALVVGGGAKFLLWICPPAGAPGLLFESFISGTKPRQAPDYPGMRSRGGDAGGCCRCGGAGVYVRSFSSRCPGFCR